MAAWSLERSAMVAALGAHSGVGWNEVTSVWLGRQLLAAVPQEDGGRKQRWINWFRGPHQSSLVRPAMARAADGSPAVRARFLPRDAKKSW